MKNLVEKIILERMTMDSLLSEKKKITHQLIQAQNRYILLKSSLSRKAEKEGISEEKLEKMFNEVKND